MSRRQPTALTCSYEALVLAAFMALLLLYIGRSPEEQRQVLKSKGAPRSRRPTHAFRQGQSAHPIGAVRCSTRRFRSRFAAFAIDPASLTASIFFSSRCFSTVSSDQSCPSSQSLRKRWCAQRSKARQLTTQGVYCPGAYSVHYAAVCVRPVPKQLIGQLRRVHRLCFDFSRTLRPDRVLYAGDPRRRVDQPDALTREQLKGHSPLAKFLTIKVRHHSCTLV